MDWDELRAFERQRIEGQVKVGGLVLDVHDDTDRLWVDFMADLSLADWEWFLDHEGVGFGGHVQSLWDTRNKRPCKDLAAVDWGRLQAQVMEAAQVIVEQSRQMPFEADAWRLYMAGKGVHAEERPWRERHWGPEAALA